MFMLEESSLRWSAEQWDCPSASSSTLLYLRICAKAGGKKNLNESSSEGDSGVKERRARRKFMKPVSQKRRLCS